METAKNIGKEQGVQFGQMEYPHLDFYWAIRDVSDSATWSNMSGVANVFTTKEKAEAFISSQRIEGAVAKRYAWKDLVETVGKAFHSIIVDHEGKPGFYSAIPLFAD